MICQTHWARKVTTEANHLRKSKPIRKKRIDTTKYEERRQKKTSGNTGTTDKTGIPTPEKTETTRPHEKTSNSRDISTPGRATPVGNACGQGKVSEI